MTNPISKAPPSTTKQISNAPEPIKPISTCSYYHKPPTIPPADYEAWCKADLWTIKRGILLLLGAEYIPYGEYGEREFYKAYQDDFDKKMKIALGSVKVGKLKSTGNTLFASELNVVLPSDFIAWARDKDYQIPIELEAIEPMTQAETVKDAGTVSKGDNEPASKKVAPVFSGFENLRANEISLVMMENKTAKIVIRGKSINVNPDELGLKAGSQDWKLLEGAAVNQGELEKTLKSLNSSSNLEAEKGKIKTAVSRLRTSLKDAIGLKDSPIRYRKDNGYKFTFKTMTHELLKGGNVSKGGDAMDYVNDEGFDESQHDSNDYWNDDELTKD
jgi:hypothetical protein